MCVRMVKITMYVSILVLMIALAESSKYDFCTYFVITDFVNVLIRESTGVA